MRDKIINALADHFVAHMNKHKINVEIMLENPMAIHDHTDLMSAIESELGHIAEYMDKLEALETLVDGV
jgi:hypothetical protein